MAHVVIIGAGLTGISAAYHLEQNGFFDYTLVEKEPTIGGLCGSVEQDGFTFDYTGHLLHINDPYFHSLIESIVGFDHFNVINRRSFIYSHERYTHYPYQVNLHGLPTSVIAECIEGYVKRKMSTTQPRTFIQWVNQNFGAGFAKHFFIPYQSKIFAYDLRKISASWTGRFVPSTSLEQIIQGALHEPTAQSIGYNAQFFYPKRGGIVSWLTKIAAKLVNPIATNTCVKTIDLRTKKITFADGHVEPYTTIINTMPLDRLLDTIIEKPTTHVKTARSKLRCNGVINFNLGLNRPNLSEKHWVYFPEEKYPFYRLGFPHNFTHHAVPNGCSSLYGEFAHVGKSQRWINETLTNALASTKKVLDIGDDEIATQVIMPISHAYVLYDQWREKNLDNLLHRLQTEDIYSTGRYGAWKYSSMQEGVLDGKTVAKEVQAACTKQSNKRTRASAY